jgi:hypothetical protein
VRAEAATGAGGELMNWMGVSDQDVQDAWARWTEARPEWADWELRLEVRTRVKDVWLEGGGHAYKDGRHQLHAAITTRVGDGRVPVAEWTTEPERLIAVVDAVTCAMREEQLMEQLRERERGAVDALERFVYARLGGA